MSNTFGKVSITGSLSQVGIMKILIIKRSITSLLPYMFTRTWQGMFCITQNLSGYSRKRIRRNTARCLFERPEKPCRPCGQSHLQSREIKFCLFCRKADKTDTKPCDRERDTI